MKIFNKLGTENFLNLIKTSNIIFNGEKLEDFLLRPDKGQDVSSYHSSKSYCKSYLMNYGKEIKGEEIVKEEIKLSLFTDNMIVYIENLIEMTKKFL